MRAENARSFAFAMPRWRVSNHAPPASGGSAIFFWICEKRVVSDATITSHASAMLKPMPTATPRVAHTIGFCTRAIARITLCMWRARRNEPFSPPMPISPMSAPEQKSVPAPVSTTARISGVSLMRSHTSASASRIASSIAFFFSGRLIVTVPTAPSTCSSIDIDLT